VYLASLLHDVAKYLNPKDYPNANIPYDVPAPVLHAFLGAYVVEHVLGIDDIEVIDAVRYHTSGKPNMSTLAKLIFVADMIEEGRDYLGVEKLRELYYQGDFEKCFIECLKEEVIHLLNKKEYVYKLTLDAYDYYVKDEKGEKI
jgi:predicted HD superfamily hydrolase involved in NAD metabolism